MKNRINRVFIATIALLGLTGNAFSQSDSLTITGDIRGLDNMPVTFTYVGKDDKVVRRDIPATNGHFVLKFPEQAEPVQGYIGSYSQIKTITKTLPDGRLVHLKPPIVNIFLYRSNLKVRGTLQELAYAEVSGDKENVDYCDYKQQTKVFEKQVDAINKRTDAMDKRTDSVAIDELGMKAGAIFQKKTEIEKKFISDHPGSYTSLLLLGNLWFHYTAAQYEETFNRLSEEYKSTKIAMGIAKRIEKLQVTAVGKQSINFTRTDKDGKTVSLSDFKGKLVLLDFWGSWCGPCRGTHPHLKELYAAYKDKGLEIVAVAQEKGKTLEASRATWLAAIKKDDINWVHVLNNEDVEKMDIVKAYSISGFPTKILLDRDGKVLMRVTSAATNDIDLLIKKLLN